MGCGCSSTDVESTPANTAVGTILSGGGTVLLDETSSASSGTVPVVEKEQQWEIQSEAKDATDLIAKGYYEDILAGLQKLESIPAADITDPSSVLTCLIDAFSKPSAATDMDAIIRMRDPSPCMPMHSTCRSQERTKGCRWNIAQR